MKAAKLAIACVAALAAVSVWAGGDRHEHAHHRVKAHHEQMMAACEGKQDGDKVSLEGPDGDAIAAVCKERPATMVAVPEKRLEHFEAMKAACAGKVEGDIVAFDTPRGKNVTGTCTTKHGELVAVPERKNGKRRD